MSGNYLHDTSRFPLRPASPRPLTQPGYLYTLYTANTCAII